MNHTSNSIVTRTDIGTGSAALLCTTTYSPCCSSANPETQWYFPNGSQVQNNGGLPYYRTRNTGRTVLLHRNPQGTTTGIFRCDILDASGVLQSMFVGIYDNGTGESCTLSEHTNCSYLVRTQPGFHTGFFAGGGGGHMATHASPTPSHSLGTSYHRGRYRISERGGTI